MMIRSHTRASTRWLYGSTLALLALVAADCSVNPATGKQQLNLISEAQEIAMGREADEQIVAQMGLYPDAELAAYVDRLGQELAAESERPELPWTFRVIDDPVVNAFALPGGYIYVTRGIMAHLTSEAQLVGILGHEIGHVTARHGVNRLSKAQLFSLGLGVGMVLSPELASFGDLLQSGMGLLFLKYSRDDERQADDLGLRYAISGGWDAREVPGVFGILQRVGEAAGSERLPGWLSTHPDPGAREERLGAKVAAAAIDFSGATVNERGYMGMLDGVVFGPNPREGFFRDGVFYHPELAFRLDFPAGWKTQNQKQAVLGVSEKQDAAVQLTLAPEEDPAAAARAFLGQEGIRSGQLRRGRIGGQRAVGADFEVPRDQNPLRGRVTFLRYDGRTYRLLGYTLSDLWSTHGGSIARFQESFARVTDPEILSVEPARLSIVDLGSDLPVDRFQSSYPSSVPVETVALINNVPVNGLLPASRGAKRVVGGPR